MSRRASLKQRLIEELTVRADALDDGSEHPWGGPLALDYREKIRQLRNRGSGPLPWWARRLAEELGLT